MDDKPMDGVIYHPQTRRKRVWGKPWVRFEWGIRCVKERHEYAGSRAKPVCKNLQDASLVIDVAGGRFVAAGRGLS